MRALNNKRIVMLGTRFDTMGGISSVVNVYRLNGLFDRFPIIYIATHCDGRVRKKLLVMLSAFFSFLKLLACGQVGLVHIQASRSASFWRKLLFVLPSCILRVPVVFHLHSGAFDKFYANDCGFIGKAIVRFVFNVSDKVVVLSSQWESWVLSVCPRSNVVSLYNPVVCEALDGADLDHAPMALLSLGRVGYNKGSFDLIRAVKLVSDSCPKVNVAIGGDGDVSEAQRLVREMRLEEHFEFLGWVTGDTKKLRLRTSGVYVLPSYSEGLPMSVLEAMAAGLPIISTPVGGIPEAVTDGVEGFLVQPGDVEALADRIGRLLADPELARRMGEAARRKVETTFSAEVLLPQLEAMYAEFGFSPRAAA